VNAHTDQRRLEREAVPRGGGDPYRPRNCIGHRPDSGGDRASYERDTQEDRAGDQTGQNPK
jgi:hypothetical protein